MTAAPCFVNCGKPACKTLGCVRVYNDGEEDAWTPTYETATPLYIGPLPETAMEVVEALAAFDTEEVESLLTPGRLGEWKKRLFDLRVRLEQEASRGS